jgi:hypothetical protein
MNNEGEFAALVHNLFKKGSKGEDHQAYKNMPASVQVSPQATKKKRFTSLDLKHS